MLKKYFVLILTLLVIIGYVMIQFSPLIKKEKVNAPVITFNQNVITVSVKDKDDVLLKGVQAYDEEDGDLSDQVVVEGLSAFYDGGKRKISYIVFDNDDHVTKASRVLQYKDYTPPVFSMSNQLRSEKYSVSELMNRVHAKSCVDGDLSSKVTVMNLSMVDSRQLKIKLSVTDSTNTTSYLNVNYYLESEKDIQIQLKKYLVYLKQGQDFDYRNNIKNVIEKLDKDNALRYAVKIKTPSMDQPGVYEVEYTIERSNGNKGKTTMIVVVE